jgi:hypothetical protein
MCILLSAHKQQVYLGAMYLSRKYGFARSGLLKRRSNSVDLMLVSRQDTESDTVSEWEV